MKEKQRVVDYLKELTKKVEESQFMVTGSIGWDRNTENIFIDSIQSTSYRNGDSITFNVVSYHDMPLKEEFKAKKGDFVVVNNGEVYQSWHNVHAGDICNSNHGIIHINTIRIATESEKEAKIKEFKSRGLIEEMDGIWREPKLEEVYCVAESKADLIRIYSVKPELIHEYADIRNINNIVCVVDSKIINVKKLSDSEKDNIKISVEKFIELLKKHKRNE